MSRNRTVAALAALGLAGTLLFGHPTPARAQAAAVPTCSQWAAQNNKIVLNIKFPGLPTTECIKSDGVKGTYAYTGTFGDYLVTFYQWFAGAAGVLAVFMVMFGGFQWLTAAGNPGRIGQAKESITGAVVGLILLLGSYVLLNTISPAFVAFKPLSPKHIDRLTLGFATCYDNTPTSGGTTSTSSGTSGIAPAAACSTGGCSPLQNAICTSEGGKCGCKVACQAGETQVSYAYCADIAQNISSFASVGAAANPGDSTFIPEPPTTWGDLFDAYSSENGGVRITNANKNLLVEWLRNAALIYGGARVTQWCVKLAKGNPLAAAVGCAGPAAVLLQWEAFKLVMPKENELVVPNSKIICCQSATDSTKCTARAADDESSGTCEQDISAVYQPCRDKTTKCGEVNKTGTPTAVVQGITQGCIGVSCTTPGYACILDYKLGKRSVPNYGGCQPAYDEVPLVPGSVEFDSGAKCAAGSISIVGLIGVSGAVGSSCGSGGNCVFINGYAGKWYESSYYKNGKCDNTGTACVDNGQCGGGTCVGGGYRTSTYSDPEGPCPGDSCAWERGGVQCYAN